MLRVVVETFTGCLVFRLLNLFVLEVRKLQEPEAAETVLSHANLLEPDIILTLRNHNIDSRRSFLVSKEDCKTANRILLASIFCVTFPCIV